MDPEDWESLPGLDDSLIPHASFLLPLSHFSVPHSRRKKLSFYGVSIPTYPSLERSLEHLQSLFLGDTNISDEEFAEKIRQGAIYIGTK